MLFSDRLSKKSPNFAPFEFYTNHWETSNLRVLSLFSCNEDSTNVFDFHQKGGASPEYLW